MELCKLIACRLFEQSCPDGLLFGSGKTAKTAEQEGLDEHRIDDSANAGEYGETMSEKDRMEPRIGMAKGDVEQDRGNCREKDKLDGVEHCELSY